VADNHAACVILHIQIFQFCNPRIHRVVGCRRSEAPCRLGHRYPREAVAIQDRWGDVVLHDGAPNGERRAWGRVYGVFDELERWQPSAVPTLQVQVTLTDETDAQALADLFDQAGYAAQDWTASVRQICKQCSEGQPPEHHEHPAPAPAAERRFGLAAPLDQAARLLGDWAAVQTRHRRHSDPVVVG
jgi:hypothetical protein